MKNKRAYQWEFPSAGICWFVFLFGVLPMICLCVLGGLFISWAMGV